MRVTCADCASDMKSTRAGWQCPSCDDHETCSLAVCGHDAATPSCGLR